jgi:hypothetical protein
MEKTYKPVIYANHELNVPELNWRTSISVDMFNFSDTTPYKIFWQLEPEDIIPTEKKLIKNHQFYDLILTYNNTVLSECSNAVFFLNNGVWTQESDPSQKKFAVSFLTSAKTMCPGHKFRVQTFKKLQQYLEGGNPALPCLLTMHMSPPYLPDKRSMLIPFQYAISIQNSQMHNYFSEILLDCFATKTIPIFWGCANVREFFNPDGILSFGNPYDPRARTTLNDVLSSLTPDFYHSPKVQAAIEENYLKSLTYSDRIGRLVNAITDSWTPKITKIHSGEPNVAPNS